MARIRTIKPEFWQDEDLARCSPHARLLAIALLQLADSEGRLKWIPMQVHAHAFPFEADLSIEDLAAELVQIGYLHQYTVQGKRYACIPGFLRHQRLSGKEAAEKSKLPPSEALGNDRGSSEFFPGKHLDAQEQGTGNREQGTGNTSPNGEDVGDHKPPPCPHQEIIKLYHETLPALPRVREWTKARQQYLAARWREKPERQSLDWWRKFFAYVADSAFLTGAVPGRQGGPPFVADLEWLVRPQNFVKVVEGKYENREAMNA